MSPDDFRELHHFEAEQALSNIKAYINNLEDWEAQEYVIADLLEMIPEDI